jgi:hypothetical protein
MRPAATSLATLLMLGWGLEFGLCDAAGTYLGTLPAILSMQAMLFITSIFTASAMISSFLIPSDGRGWCMGASLLTTSIALASSISAACIALAAVPWYASLRGDRPVLPILVLSLKTGATELFPLLVPERFRLGAGFGTIVTVAILCLAVLVGLLVVATRGRRYWRGPEPESPQDADAAATCAHGRAPKPVVKSAEQRDALQRDAPAPTLDQA